MTRSSFTTLVLIMLSLVSLHAVGSPPHEFDSADRVVEMRNVAEDAQLNAQRLLWLEKKRREKADEHLESLIRFRNETAQRVRELKQEFKEIEPILSKRKR